MQEYPFKTYTMGELIDNLGDNEIAVIAIKVKGANVGDKIYKNDDTHQLRRISKSQDSPLIINTLEISEKGAWIILREDGDN